MSMRSELSANIALTPTTKSPSWKDPAPIRTYRLSPVDRLMSSTLGAKRKTYGVLAIAQRHPRLFAWLTRK